MSTSVYVIANERGPVKIGISKDPASRLAQLRNSSPDNLTIAFHAIVAGSAGQVEKRAHTILAANRIAREWFDVSVDEAINTVKIAANDVGTHVIEAGKPTRDIIWLYGPSHNADSILAFTPMKISLCKAARELLGWTQQDLSEACGLSLVTVKRYESALRLVSQEAIDKMRDALDKAGVDFIADGESSAPSGEGVRLRNLPRPLC